MCFKERNMVRLEIAKYIGKYDIKRVVNNRVVSNESLADNDQSVAVAKPSASTNTFEKENNNSKSGIYNLIYAIKIGVLKLFGLEQESQTFESKERDVEISIEKQNVENGLIWLVKNFIKHIFALDRQKNSNDTTNSNTNLALVSCADESRLLTQN